ncbi:hypothetical protein ACWCQL_27810 [Streptomyces sp. NPDC002073]
MFEYEIATMRRADLIREAEAFRQVAQFRRATAGSVAGEDERGGKVKANRHRFTKAA